MTGAQLKAWRKFMKLSQRRAAHDLGYSRRHFQDMEEGTEPVRRSVELACAAMALGITCYNGPEDGRRK